MVIEVVFGVEQCGYLVEGDGVDVDFDVDFFGFVLNYFGVVLMMVVFGVGNQGEFEFVVCFIYQDVVVVFFGKVQFSQQFGSGGGVEFVFVYVVGDLVFVYGVD